jgi:opacity protein-like surface antigen
MKKFMLTLSALLLGAGAAQADSLQDNAFVSVLGGWSSHPGLSIGANPHAPAGDGYNAGARIGSSVDALPGFSVDADYFFNRADYSGTTAHLNSSSIMGDLIYHLDTSLPVGLYGGAGVGAVNDNLSGSLHGGSMVLGWQAIGGGELPLSRNTSLFAEYRYQNAHDANIGLTRNVGNTSNNVSIGMKFHM